MRHIWRDEFDVYSAGIDAHGLNPSAVAVMEEAGVDISTHQSKTIDELPDREYDYVITVCDHASQTCPNVPGRLARIHVSFDDPPQLAEGIDDPELALDPYRRVRDEIRDFVSNLDNYLNLP